MHFYRNRHNDQVVRKISRIQQPQRHILQAKSHYIMVPHQWTIVALLLYRTTSASHSRWETAYCEPFDRYFSSEILNISKASSLHRHNSHRLQILSQDREEKQQQVIFTIGIHRSKRRRCTKPNIRRVKSQLHWINRSFWWSRSKILILSNCGGLSIVW